MQETLEGSPRRVRPTSIYSMSHLLLQGWAMLADSCWECGVPLMRHPSGAPLLCVNCGRDATALKAATAIAAEQAEQQKAAAPEANGVASSVSSSEGEDAEAELLEPPPPLRTLLQPVLAAGDLMSGSSSRGNSLAPLRDAIGGVDLSGDVSESAQPRSIRQLPSLPAMQQQAQQQGRDASQAIAELMLDGWTMLEDHCPRCLNPLLRSRDCRTYCAGCQLYVMREGEEHGRPLPPPQLEEQLERQAAVAPLQQSAVNVALHVGPHSISASTPATAPRPPLAHPPALQQHVSAVDAAAAVVVARLAAASAELVAVEAAAAYGLLAEVQQCAAALQALSECRRSMGGPP